MNKPFKFSIRDHYPRDCYPIYEGTDDELDKTFDFMRTTYISTEHDYNLRFRIKTSVEKGQKLDVLFTNAMMSVLLSPKVMSILNKICPEQFQTFDTVIACKDGTVDTYKAINILHEIDVSDPEKRQFDYLSDNKTIIGYKNNKFIIKDQPIEPIHIGRDKYSSVVIISATLKEAFEKAKVKGCQYWQGDKP